MRHVITVVGAVGLWVGSFVLNQPAYAIFCPPNTTPLGNQCV